MDAYEALELARTAIEKVSHIAITLGKIKKRPVCGELGTELFITAGYLASVGPDQEARLLRKAHKLLRDVERICSYPSAPQDDFPLLRDIAQEMPNTSSYSLAEDRIRKGLIAMTANKGELAKEAISHIQKFTKVGGVKKPNTDEVNVAPKSTPVEYPDEVKSLLYNILQKHVYCTCYCEAVEDIHEKRHLTRLLLRHAPPVDRDGNVQFDMLFSSAPLKKESKFGCWQDVQLLVPKTMRTPEAPRKRVRFPDSGGDTADSQIHKSFEEINPGQFCKLISLEVNARLCLRIQDGQLQRSLDSEPLKQIVEHTQGISLATVLQNYHLTSKMKAMLAYILAQSVWQFYDSDWMKAQWTSETIQFMRQYSRIVREGEPDVFPTNPYFSVRFGEDVVDSCEATTTAGEIHRYPRVRALGIMLVEIGLGSLIPRPENESDNSKTLKANSDWSWAKQYSDLDEPWPDFDYGKYRTAVKMCLDPRTFATAPFSPNASKKELAEGLIKRRKILYDQVVFPLEELVQGTGWKDELHKIGPLKSHKPRKATSDIPEIPGTTKTEALAEQKHSKRWLKRIDHLNAELKSTSLQNIPQPRIRIVVLDTDYDADAAFFQPNARRNRLIKWKDWVEDAKEPQDCHGHGTHLVSLIMRMAPEADICVARVAKDPKGLNNASDNVAEAIHWAQSQCEADIISMSFGYIDDQQSISKAIRNAINNCNESILFFAAAANSGANEREMFPARHESVISIRGTNSVGRFQDFNPTRQSRESTVFGTLGLEVPSASLSHIVGDVNRSGTSIATAVAAGIAGMLLGYVNGKSSKSTHHMVRERLRTREGMLAMFESIASPSLDDGYSYVAPWCLQGIADEIRWAKFEAAISKIS